MFISSAYSFSSSAQAINDLSEQKLTGKVKSLTEYSYEVKKIHGKQQNVLIGKNGYNYNEQGNKSIEYTYNPDGTLDAKSVFIYDEKGILIEEDSYNPDGSSGFTNTYKYDRRGNITSIKLYDTYGSLFVRTASDYDNNNNETEEINYTQILENDRHKDIVLNKTTWRYDDKGNMIEERYYERDTTMTRHTFYKYDENGNKVEQSKWESGITLKTTYKYNSDGNPIEETQYDAGNYIALKIITTYDDKGNETQERFYDRDNNLQTQTIFQLSYDKNGNWIRKTQLDNDKIIVITVREIAYY